MIWVGSISSPNLDTKKSPDKICKIFCAPWAWTMAMSITAQPSCNPNPKRKPIMQNIKVLLVDDEKDCVNFLSERIQMRELDFKNCL